MEKGFDAVHPYPTALDLSAQDRSQLLLAGVEAGQQVNGRHRNDPRLDSSSV